MKTKLRWKWLSNTDFRFIILLLLVTAPFLFLNAFRYSFPLGFAGLYTLMAKLIAENHFLLPSQVPFYGPGGIPFVYPPLALYVMAIGIKIVQIPIFTYLKFAPPGFAVLSILPTFFLIKQITKSRAISALAITFFILLPPFYVDNVQSGGVVRGLANLITLSGLYYGYKGINEKRYILGLVCGFFFGLTLMTHLTYALFFAISIFIFSIHRKNLLPRLSIAAEVALVGLVISVPWWGRLFSEYGVQIFQSALGSHHNLAFINDLSHFHSLYNTYFGAFSNITFLGPIVLLGLGYCLYRKRWMVFVWFVVTLFFVSEGGQFVVIVGGIIGAMFLFDAVQFFSKRLLSKNPYFPNFLMIEILLLSNLLPVLQIAKSRPKISSDMLIMAAWVQSSTDPSAKYLYLSNSEEDMEWLPFLLQRTPAFGHWGAEWTGHYSQQEDLILENIYCSNHPSLNCLSGLIADADMEPEFLIIPKHSGQESLASQILSVWKWPLVYQNDSYWVWKWIGTPSLVGYSL